MPPRGTNARAALPEGAHHPKRARANLLWRPSTSSTSPRCLVRRRYPSSKPSLKSPTKPRTVTGLPSTWGRPLLATRQKDRAVGGKASVAEPHRAEGIRPHGVWPSATTSYQRVRKSLPSAKEIVRLDADVASMLHESASPLSQMDLAARATIHFDDDTQIGCPHLSALQNTWRVDTT